MRKLAVALALFAVAVGPACSKSQALEVSTGSDVTVQRKDGVTVTGRLVEVQPNRIVVETRNGEKMSVPRADIATMRADVTPAAETPAPAASPATPASVAAASERAPEYREITIPSGTVLPVDLQTAVGSDTSRVEDPVRGTLRRAVTVGGVQVLPAGTVVTGHVTHAERSARVKGRAQIAFRFTRLDPPGDSERVAIQTGVISRLAAATKKQDAAKIGGGAVGGAIVGGIIGGGDGAAKGAAIGGAAGTGVVLSTRGKEVRLGPGADLSVKLTAPVTVRVRS